MKRLPLIITIVLVIIASIFLLRPVCKEMLFETTEDYQSLLPTLEQQNERGMLYKKWKIDSEGLHYCEAYIERFF